MGYVAHELNLSNAQKQQIRSMWQAERPAVSGLIQEFAAESKEMDQATANGNLDESKVQEIAARQGRLCQSSWWRRSISQPRFTRRF